MTNKLSVCIKDALRRAYCIVNYRYFETEDWSYFEEHQDTHYYVKVDIYFSKNLTNNIVSKINKVANDKMTELSSGIKINLGIPVNCFYEVAELPEDSDLFPNPQNFYVVNGADIRPKIISKKGAEVSSGLDGIKCYIRKQEFKDANNMTEKDRKRFVTTIEKIPPKYVRGTYTYGHLSTSLWLDPWVVKNDFVDYKPDAPLLFYQHSHPELRW